MTGALVLVPVLLAVVVGVAVSASRCEHESSPTAVELDAVDSLTVASVGEMVTAADCVLRGEVVHTERGREIGSGLESRLVQIRVDEALAGDCPTDTVVLEEEGWLAGSEVAVEGWSASVEGDVGVWFLLAGRSDELPYASTVAVAGAPRWRDGESVAPDSSPGWLRDAVANGPEGLVRLVRSTG